MNDYDYLRKVDFDGIGYLTPLGIREMLVNDVEFLSIYQNNIHNFEPLNDIRPFKLVFMKGDETVTLYENLISQYDIELDLSVKHESSFGYIQPWLSPSFHGWKKMFTRFSKTRILRVNLYGFFRLIKNNYRDQHGNYRHNFYLQATNNAYVEGISVDQSFYCYIDNERIADYEDEEIPYPLTTIDYKCPKEGYFGRVFYSEDSVIMRFEDKRIAYKEILADIGIQDMKPIEVTTLEEDSNEVIEETTISDKPATSAALKILGTLLIESVHNKKYFSSESDLIKYLEELFDKRLKGAVYGLKKRNLEDIFAQAKEAIITDIPDIKIDEKNFRRLKDAIKLENNPKKNDSTASSI